MEEKYTDKNDILRRVEEKTVGSEVCSEPDVSVVIPAYNSSRYIEETLNGVFSQKYQDFEVILVNDGSKDTKELERRLSEYKDRLVYLCQENGGAASARNLGICAARGEYVAFLDGDDIWRPGYLEKQLAFLRKSGADVVYCDAELFGETKDGLTYMETTPSEGEVSPTSLLTAKCNVITSGTIVRKSALETHGLFDPRADSFEDFELWFRLSKNGVPIDYQRDVLVRYRVSSTSLSGGNVQRAERNVAVLEFIREKYELNERESVVLETQLQFSEAEVELEKGKFYLIEGKYEKARTSFRRANLYYRKPKLVLIDWLMRVSPSLTLKLFKKLRPTEFSFITPDASK